jgi:hypothetical protein
MSSLRAVVVVILLGAAVHAHAQGVAPDPAKPRGVWVLANQVLPFDAAAVKALAPDCSVAPQTTESGRAAVSLTCPGYAVDLYPQFVPAEKLDAFRENVREQLVLMTMAAMIVPEAFGAGHPLNRRLAEIRQVINVYVKTGFDPAGKAATLIKSLAAKCAGIIYSMNTVYEADGSRILGLSGEPDTF